MKYELKFQIYGIDEDSDLAVFEIDLPPPVTTDVLMPIMAWHEGEHAMASQLLTARQISAIERLAMIKFPRNLRLYISSYL
ncbi:hypothetical protein EJA72_09640 [Pseudomonas sp. PB120]|uniref:hypothetical protein n=1 Tax=Pseudomonas sp. PB120 TaxID=2494700 RepID=UPI0012FDCCC7|nr:hypothetical protein [Pseudomonas sp. PB120]MVV48501.1 hypothetical protein [Pseudomonas sp. PB120]